MNQNSLSCILCSDVLRVQSDVSNTHCSFPVYSLISTHHLNPIKTLNILNILDSQNNNLPQQFLIIQKSRRDSKMIISNKTTLFAIQGIEKQHMIIESLKKNVKMQARTLGLSLKSMFEDLNSSGEANLEDTIDQVLRQRIHVEGHFNKIFFVFGPLSFIFIIVLVMLMLDLDLSILIRQGQVGVQHIIFHWVLYIGSLFMGQSFLIRVHFAVNLYNQT